ncbi:MAG: acyl carrier protein [Endomicrobiales bacterium]|nr:acyl carrier protein [Endomicrobiales bacterium]
MAKPKDFKKEARKLISQIAEIPEKDLKDEAKFTEDLGVDSMKALEIVAAIEKKLKIAIPEDKIPTIRTPKDVYEIVAKLV